VAMGRLGDDAAWFFSLFFLLMCAAHHAYAPTCVCILLFCVNVYIIWHVYRIIRPKGAAVLCMIRIVIRIMYNTYYLFMYYATLPGGVP
jgi:hypothetical membrane protein